MFVKLMTSGGPSCDSLRSKALQGWYFPVAADCWLLTKPSCLNPPVFLFEPYTHEALIDTGQYLEFSRPLPHMCPVIRQPVRRQIERLENWQQK